MVRNVANSGKPVLAAIIQDDVVPKVEVQRPLKKSRTTPGLPRPPVVQSLPPTPRKRAEWNTENIETMLDLRYSEFAKMRFLKCKTNREKGEWWKWFTENINLESNPTSPLIKFVIE
jgi:hypothetical protein